MIDTRDDVASPEPATSASAGRRAARIAWYAVVSVVVAASFGVWLYAFSGAAVRDAPDLLDSDAFAVAAESTCAATLAELAELPDALDAVDGEDRANQIRTSTARFELMLDDLDGLVGGTEHDVEIATGWLADWRVLIEDRYRYADAIAIDDAAQFLVTDVGVAERLDRRITRMANTNAMPSCAAPTDVG